MRDMITMGSGVYGNCINWFGLLIFLQLRSLEFPSTNTWPIFVDWEPWLGEIPENRSRRRFVSDSASRTLHLCWMGLCKFLIDFPPDLCWFNLFLPQGGLPAWLLQKNASMVIRSSDPSEFIKTLSGCWFHFLLMSILNTRSYISNR